MKEKCYKIFILGASLLILVLESGLLVTIFLSKDFTVVIFTSVLISIVSFLTVAVVCYPLLDNVFSPLGRKKDKLGEASGLSDGIEVAVPDQAPHDQKEFIIDVTSGASLRKFQSALIKAADQQAVVGAAIDAFEGAQGIESAMLLLISEDRQKAHLYRLFPDGKAEAKEVSFDRQGPALQGMQAAASGLRRDVSGQPDLNELEKVFARQGYRDTVTLPITNEGVFFGIIGAASKQNNGLSPEGAQFVEIIAGLMGFRIGYFKIFSGIREKEKQLSDLKHAEKEKMEKEVADLRDAYGRVVQTSKMASLGQLSAGVAHELNNPIGGILGYTQLVLNKLKSSSTPTQETVESIVRYLEMVEKESKRCQGIVSNLLNFSRKPSEEMVEVDVQEVINNTVSMMEYQLSEKHINVTSTFPPEGLKKIRGNANQLQQVFTNLISNAQDAMNDGGQLTIVGVNKADIRYKQPLEYVEIVFTDTGSGISKENLPKIFDPFFTSKMGKAGTGLGLAITYTIISYHKGTIKVESEEGKGTTFTVAFPIFKEIKTV